MNRHAVFLCAVAVAAWLGTLGLDPGSGSLTLDEVRAKVRAARGVRPPSERIVTNFTRQGLSGRSVELRAGGDFRVDETSGPFHEAYGSSGDVGWYQNANGEVIDEPAGGDGDGSEELNADDEFHTTHLTHETAPVERYVISRLNSLGFGTKQYVDPATWHVVREDELEPTATTTTLYDDFRTTAGSTRAWHSTTSDGHPENDASYTIASIDTGPIPPAALAVPDETAHPFVTFPAGPSRVQLPVTYDRNDSKFIVKVNVNGQILPFLLDTGASGIFIDPGAAKRLGLTEYGAYSNGINAGRFTGTRTIAANVSVGPLTMHDVEMDTAPVGFHEDGPFDFVGLLGFDFIDALALELDYERGSAFASKTDGYTFPEGNHLIDLDIRLQGGNPVTTLVINGASGDNFGIDTGGAGAVLITDQFRRHHPGAVVDSNGAGVFSTLSGAGGDFKARYVKLATMTIGNATFTDFGAFVLDEAKLYSDDTDGQIGPDLLRLYTVYLDYYTREVRLIPNSAGMTGVVPTRH